MNEELIEAMCAAAWNVHGKPSWDQIPKEWKPFHRECMAAALEVAQNPFINRIQDQIHDIRKRDLEERIRATATPCPVKWL